LGEILAQVEDTYCRSIGVEFTQIEDREERQWLQFRMEACRNRPTLTDDERRHLLRTLTAAESFEQFIHKSFQGAKRFSLEGAESLVPLLDTLIEQGAELAVEEVVIGMAHRGRLNVLVNVLQRDVREIFGHFADANPEEHIGRGDVKYHFGYRNDLRTTKGRPVSASLSLNPSHLEWVYPTVEGRTRGRQDIGRDGARRRAVPIVVHGDAAIMGQGVVAETLNMSELPGYTTGGSIHVIVNNQVGFTTNPADTRSTRYASDIARMLRIPVFHVNGDDPEAVVHVSRLAMEHRMRFQRSVMIDLYCYRRHGHNEADNPRFTQPRMYDAIDGKPSVRALYVQRLANAGSPVALDAEAMAQEAERRLASALVEARSPAFSAAPKREIRGVWKSYRGGPDAETPDVDTGVSLESLGRLLGALSELPPGFTPAVRQIEQLMAQRRKALEGGPMSWGMAEHLALATLLDAGTSVRFTGQDVRRGTFSHRHAVLADKDGLTTYTPLSAVARPGTVFEIYDSPLSEAGVLGFEYGYSRERPDALVVWEAQFGDFANCAQVIIDQFLASSEDKWHRVSGLVLLLPHGFEGQGPEHSSARLERFLQLAAEDNMQICNLTTAAQYFHVLRRQAIRPWRKPLVIMSPKSLLRDDRAATTLAELARSRFRRVIGDDSVAPADARRVLICSGKVYHELVAARRERGIRDIAIVRLEQLYPLDSELDVVLSAYRRETPVVWVQEEPANMGGWYFVNAHLPARLGGKTLSLVSRPESASPATGSFAAHQIEQRLLLGEALS
ncbi:MAG: 2-oxoglutarate dehydrogenase E1 component, partial [Deltaproteobacteria bacterium]|nr:2-oxoglutarate dehydrogenase E1 component [Deltaproteobacteria bacterium]